MHTRYSMGGGILIAVFLSTTASFAQVTPRQVWDNWRDYMEGYGYTVAANEMAADGAIDVTGLTMSMEMPEDAGSMTVTFGDIRFVDNGDGSVAIVMPESAPVSLKMRSSDGEAVDMAFTYNLPGMEMTAKGSPEDMQYAFTGDEVSVKLDSLIVDGKSMDVATFQFGMADVSSNWTIKTGDLRVIQQTLIAAGGLRYEFTVNDPEGEGSFAIRGQSTRLSMSGTTAVPLEYDPTDMYRAFKDGMAIDIAVGLGAGKTDFSFRDGNDFATGSSSTGSSNYSLAMDMSRLSYGIKATKGTAALTGSDLPFPINYSADEFAVDMVFPLARSEEPQDVSAVLRLVNFAPDDMIWGMLDPTGAMSHDPATLIIDIVAKADWMIDVLDPANIEALTGSEIPFKLHSLSLNELKLSAVGVELAGSGSFVFNNDDLETFDGLPAPDGAIDLKLVGANGLIDTLIAMGLMSNDDAQGMRMMMGLFGRPGEGEDEVLSTIEVKSNGQIFANGQRLQ